MKFLFDLFPVILFFVVYKLADGQQDAAHALMTHYFGPLIGDGRITPAQSPILLATVAAIVATFAQIGYLLARRRKVDPALWVSLAIITVMGGATLYFHDENFIKWKPTVLYWVFALVLAVAQFGMRNNLIRKLMGAALPLPDAVWARLGVAWMLFFAALGALNLLMAFVVFKHDTGAWVSFKLFGATGLLFAFIVGQTVVLSKYIKEDA